MRIRVLFLVAAILFAVFIVEAGVMVVIKFYFELPSFVEILLDSTLLVITLFPFLYFLVFRPLTQEIVRYKQERVLRSDLIQMVVHDLKNPLTTIASVASLLEHDAKGSPDEVHRRKLDALNISERRLSSLIGNLLHLGTMKEGAMEVKPVVVLVCDICRDLEWLDVLAHHEQKKFVRCEKYGDVEVFADRELITRVLENLLINAFKHTRKGEEIHLEIVKVDDQVRFEVYDNGEGIPQEYLEHIFDSMFTMDRIGHFPPTMSAGTGLGLAFCKMAVKAHNAELKVDSEPGKRTSFWFTLMSGY